MAEHDPAVQSMLAGAAKGLTEVLQRRYPDLHFEVTIKPPDQRNEDERKRKDGRTSPP